jgi:hypothetical protein
MNRSFSIALIFAICAASLAAKPKGWDNIRQIKAGHPIRVHTAGQKQTGTFVGIEESAVRFRTTAGTEVTVPRAEVARVYAQSASHRRRNFVIGAIVGVAVGAAVYGTLGALLENEGGEDAAALLFVPIAVGGAVGAVLPTGTMKLMYDAKKQ